MRGASVLAGTSKRKDPSPSQGKDAYSVSGLNNPQRFMKREDTLELKYNNEFMVQKASKNLWEKGEGMCDCKTPQILSINSGSSIESPKR